MPQPVGEVIIKILGHIGSDQSTTLNIKLMGLEPRQHLLEGSSLGLHDLSVIIFSNHSKACHCQLDLQGHRLRAD